MYVVNYVYGVSFEVSGRNLSSFFFSNGGFRDTATTNADSALESISIDRQVNEPAPALFDPSPPLNYQSL